MTDTHPLFLFFSHPFSTDRTHPQDKIRLF
jgi:hypothetical protein